MPPLRTRVLVAVLLVVAVVAPAQATALSGPKLETKASLLASSLKCPKTFTHAKHEPVLLVHGTFSTGSDNWGWSYVPALTKASYDVCIVNLPNNSLDDIQVQSEYVVYAIRQIKARSHKKVDVLGASQGTLQPRWAVKWWPDVRASVDDLVMLAGPHHGTLATALATRCFPSCWQMKQKSKFITALNKTDETPGAISYTSIFSTTDELVQPELPTSTAELKGARNIRIQDLCPGRPTDHVALSTSDAVGYWLAVDAFSHPGPANPARFDVTTCLQAIGPGMEPVSLFSQDPGNMKFTWTTSEPPLKAYAR